MVCPLNRQKHVNNKNVRAIPCGCPMSEAKKNTETKIFYFDADNTEDADFLFINLFLPAFIRIDPQLNIS
jgi:hypothetical protein